MKAEVKSWRQWVVQEQRLHGYKMLDRIEMWRRIASMRQAGRLNLRDEIAVRMAAVGIV
jgi:hypothetical protein